MQQSKNYPTGQPVKRKAESGSLVFGFPLSPAFLADALDNFADVLRFHLLVSALDYGECSLRAAARLFGTSPLPDCLDAALVAIVGHKRLDCKRLSLANLHISSLFDKHFGTGALIVGEREGLGFDRVTKDGRRVAAAVAYLVHHWVNQLLDGPRSPPPPDTGHPAKA